jgi:hypothetical protein
VVQANSSEYAATSADLRRLEERIAALSEQMRDLVQIVTTATEKPRGIELLKKLGVTPDRFLERYFEALPETDYYSALHGGLEPLGSKPGILSLGSTLCRQLHFSTDEFRFWMKAMARPPRMHRKEWEWFYVAQILHENGLLRPGNRGLGFAVGQEPLPALFASYGCEIVATDQAPEMAHESGWASTPMYSSQVDSLYNEQICDRATFYNLVSYKNADMNDIPAEFSGGFDFCWSSCALEHLGSLDHGLKFIEKSMESLSPGGIAVHTTEFNMSSNDDTLETPGCSIYRKRDIEELKQRLSDAGYVLEAVDWTDGRGFAETVVDLPPYRQSPHLRLRIGQFDCTSLGLVVRKPRVK